MKRIIKITIATVFALFLISSGARASEASREYTVESCDGEYIISVYSDGEAIPVTSFPDLRSAFSHFNSLGGRISLYFSDFQKTS